MGKVRLVRSKFWVAGFVLLLAASCGQSGTSNETATSAASVTGSTASPVQSARPTGTPNPTEGWKSAPSSDGYTVSYPSSITEIDCQGSLSFAANPKLLACNQSSVSDDVFYFSCGQNAPPYHDVLSTPGVDQEGFTIKSVKVGGQPATRSVLSSNGTIKISYHVISPKWRCFFNYTHALGPDLTTIFDQMVETTLQFT